MKVLLGRNHRPVTVDSGTLLGKGGEKLIHRDPDHPRSRAIAIYHNPTSERVAKLEHFLHSGLVLPDSVIAPGELVFDTRQRVIGFSMKQLNRRYKDLQSIFTPSFCQTHRITTHVVAKMFLHLGELLQQTHDAKCVVGDLNDGAAMFHTDNHSVAMVDVDSWSIGQYPCTVGSKLYLPPDLYNTDLSTGNYFEPWMDWYAFAVLLFRGLLRKHPFKSGTHAKYTGVFERAIHGKTVLDRGVRFPKKGLQPDMLSDDLAEALLKHLKRKVKRSFPLDVLRAYQNELVECESCRVWYPASRPHCPACSTKTTVDLHAVIGIPTELLAEVNGHILFVRAFDRKVLIVYEDQRKLFAAVSDSGHQAKHIQIGLNYEPGMSFGFFGDTLVICVDDPDQENHADLYLLELGSDGVLPVCQTTTGVLAGKHPIFGTSPTHLYRIAGNMIICEERFGASDLLPRQVTQIIPEQCWFVVDTNPVPGTEVLVGCNRDVDREFWFLARSNPGEKHFTRYDVPLSELKTGEVIRNLEAYFSNERVLVVRKTRQRGKDQVRLDLVSTENGNVLSSTVVDPDKRSEWERIDGKGFAKGTILHPTDDGILSENVSTQAKTLIPGTTQALSRDDALIPHGRGAIIIRDKSVNIVTP